MKTTMAWTVLVAALSIGAPLPLQGQPQALDALLAEADRSSPRIEGARRTAEASAAAVPQAGALPDPMIGVGLMNVPVTRPGLGNDMMTMTQLRVGAELPWPGKLGLQEEIARLESQAAGWEVERVRQELHAEVASVYYRVYFLERALELTRRNELLMRDFATLTSARYAVGGASQPDVLKAQVERTALADQLVALDGERAGAVARLNALLGRATDAELASSELPEAVRAAALRPVPRATFASAALADVLPSSGAVGGVPSVAELQRLALEHNPMIQAHAQRLGARGRAVSLAEKATLPDLSVSAGYSHRAGFGDFFDVMVSAPIPLFSGRKQRKGVIEQAAVLGEHEARHAAMVDELNGEVASLAADLARARAQLALLDEAILPQTRTGLASAAASYQVGRSDFLTVLDAQASLYRHEVEYHRLLADFATNLAALERAVGTEVLR